MKIEHVVIADDDDDDVELLNESITHYSPSVQVKVVSDGNELLEYLNSALLLPEVVILDLHMPKYNGIECLRTIRAIERFTDIIIVVFSSSSYREDRDECLSLGANYYVTKPAELDRVMQFAEAVGKGTFMFD